MPKYALKPKKTTWRRLSLGLIVLVLLIAIAGVFMVRRTYEQNLQAASATQRRVLVTIALGSSASSIAKQLKDQGVIRSDWAFEWYIRNHGLRNKLQAGSYYLSPNQPVPEIVTALTQGKVATDLVTVLPAQRLDQIRTALINSGFSEADVAAALDPAQYKNEPALVDKPVGNNLEGYLYPDSYQKTLDTQASTVIRASLAQMQKRLTPDLRASIERQGLTVYQGIVLASIVEQEVSKAEDKPVVAQVFLKRLRMGMVLGSDVTAYYGALKAGQEPSLSYDSPYNTHLHAGLPPTPISNVTESSLHAVANPASSDYLYFVAGDDGVTYFSRTLEEHNQNVATHCKKLCPQ